MEAARSPGVFVHPESESRDPSQELGTGDGLLDGGGVLLGQVVDDPLLVEEGGRSVGGGVVDQHQSVDRTALAGETCEAFEEKVLAVVCHHHGDNRFPPSSSILKKGGSTIKVHCSLSNNPIGSFCVF